MRGTPRGRGPAIAGALVAGAWLAGCATGSGIGDGATSDPADGLSLDAHLSVGRGLGEGVWSADIRIPPRGDALVAFVYFNPDLRGTGPGVRAPRVGSPLSEEQLEAANRAEPMLRAEQRVRLDEADRGALAAAVDRSGFFGEWPEGGGITCQDTWTVTIRRGGAVAAREVYVQPEFREVEKFLWRLVRQAVGEWSHAAGRTDILGYLLADDRPDPLLHPERLPESVPPEAAAITGCPDPSCPAATGRAPPRPTRLDREQRVAEALAAILAPDSITIDAREESPVRGRLSSSGHEILVEVCVKEVRVDPEQPAFVRFTLRLCDADGKTIGYELRPSGRGDREEERVPVNWPRDAVEGVPFHRYFACPMGTAWEMDAFADAIDGGVVRFTLLGRFIVCTK